MNRFTGLVLVALGGALSPMQVQGQASLGLDLGLNSQYVWRGVTRSEQFVTTPGVWLTLRGGGNAITAGARGQVEFVPSQGGQLNLRGIDNVGLGQVDYFLQYVRSFPGVNLGVGGMLYTYQGVPSGNLSSTSELYSLIEVTALPIKPSVRAFYDLDQVAGAYLEGVVSHSLSLGPLVVLDLGGLAGFNAGQGQSSNASEVGYFAENGFTHVDVSAGLRLALGPLALGPEVHYLRNLDAATKIVGTGLDQLNSPHKAWVGFALRWFGGSDQLPR